MAVQEIEVVGVTELWLNQRGVPDLTSSHGTLSPQLRGENWDTEEGQSQKKNGKKEPRVQSLHSRLGVSYACPELFLMQSGLSLGARPAIVHLLFQTAAWAEKYLVWLFIRRGCSSSREVFGYYQYCCCHGPWGYEAKGSATGLRGGDRGLVWLSHNNRGCPSPLGRPRLDPPERVTEWMATVTFSQACVLEYSKWEFQTLPTHTHTHTHSVPDLW